MRVAENELYQVYFSQEILDGATRNLIKNGRFDLAKASRFQALLIKAFPEAMVEVPDGLTAVMTNDPGDRHVLAAVVCGAEVIVTFNLKDFLPEALEPWSIEVRHPDVFLCELCDLHRIEQLTQIVQKQAEERQRPQTTVLELLSSLEKQVPKFVSQVATKLYGQEVEDVARTIVEKLPKVNGSNSRWYPGEIYDLRLTNGTLTITTKDGRGEILKSQAGNVKGALSPEDIIRFQKSKKKL